DFELRPLRSHVGSRADGQLAKKPLTCCLPPKPTKTGENVNLQRREKSTATTTAKTTKTKLPSFVLL
ncbi:unnamed protein product, partial [Ceratitis capitata]